MISEDCGFSIIQIHGELINMSLLKVVITTNYIFK